MSEQGQKLAAASAATLIAEPALALAHQGGLGVILGLAAGAAAYLAVDEVQRLHRERGASGDTPTPDAVVPAKASAAALSVGKRLLVGKSVREESRVTTEPLQDEITRAPLPARLTLSQLLASGFVPSLDQIFLAYLPDGTPITVRAKDLCHVALAGATGGGKSSMMRLLMAQLCAAGANVLLLNPHYTGYDIESDPPEDWTPFEPYLVYSPMECRKYDVIEFYLKQIAEDKLPKRLDKRAHSQSIGRPYFVVLDEYPAIVAEIAKAPEYLAYILREGRKVGIYLITAAQDFLVSTIGGNGAVRDCYRTAMYVGGDGTTGKTLLDMPAKEIPETKLGEGTIMLRCKTTKQAVLARVPYVDNQSLYRLLGPSTFDGSDESEDEEDELITHMVTRQMPTEPRTDEVRIARAPSRTSYDAYQERKAHKPRAYTKERTAVTVEAMQSSKERKRELTRDESVVKEAYESGLKSGNAIAGKTGIPATRVNQILNSLAADKLIDWQPRNR